MEILRNHDIPAQPILPDGGYIRIRKLVEIMCDLESPNSVREKERVPVNDECVKIEDGRVLLLGDNIELDITDEFGGEQPKFAWMDE